MILDARDVVTLPHGRYKTNSSDIIGIAVHHSVTSISAQATIGQERAHIKNIDAYHISKGYGGYAYHMTAFPSGRAYQTGDLNGARAHVQNRNNELIGVVCIGDFSTTLPALPQQMALKECLDYMLTAYPDRAIGGHTEWALDDDPTSCPGVIQSINWEEFLAASGYLKSNGFFSELHCTDANGTDVIQRRWGSSDGLHQARESFLLGDTWWWLRFFQDDGQLSRTPYISSTEGD